jgi:hypothetical protein
MTPRILQCMRFAHSANSTEGPTPRTGRRRREPWRLLSILGGALGLCLTRTAEAQSVSPLVLVEAGLLTADFLSAPPNVTATSGFNFRFVSLIPTPWPRFSVMLGASLTPYGTTGFGGRNTNAPGVFAGVATPLVDERSTGGWFRVDLPLLWYYTYGGGGEHNREVYGRDIYAELAIGIPLGTKLLRDLGPGWSHVEGYVRFDQNLTPNRQQVSRRLDRFNPIAMYGVSLRFGSRPPRT